MKYVVHAKTIVNVTLQPIEAASQKDALEQAQEILRPKLNDLFRVPDPRDLQIKHVESGDDFECFLVDEEGDAEYAKSEWYAANGDLMVPNGCERCNVVPGVRT